MSQPGAPRAAAPGVPNAGATNTLEIVAYIFAQTLKLSVLYALSFTGLLNPLYVWAMQAGGRTALYAVSIGLSIGWGALTLLAFFVSRTLLGGVPANTPRGPEIGMFALSYAIVTAVLLVLNAAVLSQVYQALGPMRAPLLGFGLSIVSAALTFALFVALRQLIRAERTAA